MVEAIGQSTTAAAGRDEFLTLLVAQVRNQDPLDPVGQEEFISQLAQFSTLEGIEELNSNFGELLEANQSLLRMNELTQGEALIGRTVNFSTGDETKSGVVDAVEFKGGVASVVVDGQSVSIDNIQRLSA